MGAVGFGFGFALGKFLFRVLLKLSPFLIVAGIAIAIFVPATPRPRGETRVGVADHIEIAEPETVTVAAPVYDSPFDDVALTTTINGAWARCYAVEGGGEACCQTGAVDKNGVGPIACTFPSSGPRDVNAIMRRFRTDYEAAHCRTDAKGKLVECRP